MAYKNLLVLLVSLVAIVLVSQSASAFGNIAHVEVGGIDADDGDVDFATFRGDQIPVLVRFDATENAHDVKIVAWISGDRRNGVESLRFDVVANRTYTQVVYLDSPADLDDLYESRTLEIVVESEEDGTADSATVQLTAQRVSYELEILSIDMLPEVAAGESLFIDVVLKNRGSHFADDTFLRVSVPELQIESRAYFGDLAPVDQANPDKEDAVERRAYLRIPVNTPTGVYTVRLQAANSDSSVETERRVFISGAERESRVITSSTTKTFGTSEQAEYSFTIVNKASEIQVYDLVVNAPEDLNVAVSDSIVIVPAGSSKTVTVTADSDIAGKYSFSVNVHAEDGSLVSENTFKAIVEEGRTGFSSARGTATNATVLLTVILAIVFVVLLVVLIVLLTRKSEKSEEFGESYY